MRIANNSRKAIYVGAAHIISLPAHFKLFNGVISYSHHPALCSLFFLSV